MVEWVDKIVSGLGPLIGVIVGGGVTYFVQSRLAGAKQMQDRQTNAALLAAVLREYQAKCTHGYYAVRNHNEEHRDESYHRPDLPPPLTTEDIKLRVALLPPNAARLVLELHVRAISDDNSLDMLAEVDEFQMRAAIPKCFAELVIEVDKVVRRLSVLAGWPEQKREPDDPLSWIEAYLAWIEAYLGDLKKREREPAISLD